MCKLLLLLLVSLSFIPLGEAFVGGAARAAGAAAAAASKWVNRVKTPSKNWVEHVEKSRTNQGGNQGRGKDLGGDSRSSSGNGGKKDL
jgi:hypothetical protein